MDNSIAQERKYGNKQQRKAEGDTTTDMKEIKITPRKYCG